MTEGPTIRQQLSTIARRGNVPLPRVLEEWTERSAIREYLGGLSREDAEREAVHDTAAVLEVL
jgi:hypothetical protein